jgi:hypothetical protein
MAAAQLVDPVTMPDQLTQQLENLMSTEEAEPSVKPVDLRRQALGRCWGA